VDLGFETIGNATLICHDSGPVLVTDPWVRGSAYFGSWKLSHVVPPEQLAAVENAPFVWFSHGHPDHLNGESLPLARGKQILLPDHVGGRIRQDLIGQGFTVRVLGDREWVELSPRIRVACVADYNQDAILLVDIGGKLLVNLNDASPRGWGRFVRETLRRFPQSFLLALHGYGDADMLNYFDERGERLPLPERVPLGQTIARQCDFWGVRWFVPFSSMHRYQRTDSAWAAPVAAQPSDYENGFASKRCELLPPFIRFDCAHDRFERIDPAETPDELLPPERFGDDWSETLDRDEFQRAQSYLLAVEKLHGALDFINLKVGGRDHLIRFPSSQRKRGLTFEAPRRSLMSAIDWRIFDDLLIGNFTKVTLHGDWGARRLYPDFTPWVAKYADNGDARTQRELHEYFTQYRRRDRLGHWQHLVELKCILPLQQSAGNVIRGSLGADSTIYRAAKRGYWLLRRAI
jgi:hypothetical protein